MGDFNMVPCSHLRKRSKIRKSSALGVSKHRSKVLKSSRGENEAESELELKFFSSMTQQLLTEILIILISTIQLTYQMNYPFPCAFGVCQGQFRVACLTYKEADGHVLLIWDLEDYHKGVWQLAHRLLLRQPSLKKYKYKFTQLMAFHPYNRDIVFVEINNGVFQFNLRTGILETYYELKLEKGCYFRMLEPSSLPLLFHRGFPTAVPS